MPAVMMAPMGMGVTRDAMRAKDALPIRSHHQAAAWSSDNTGIDDGIIVIGIIIIIRVVVVIDAADEHSAEAMPVSKPVSGKPGSPCDHRGSRAERTAANGGATEAAATADTTAAAAASATTAVSAAHFTREPSGGSHARSCATGIDWRQRFSALASQRR